MSNEPIHPVSTESGSSHLYEVVVGNVGTVYRGDSHTDAKRVFAEYVSRSTSYVGRAAGESVTLIKDEEIEEEHTPGLEWWQGRVSSSDWDLVKLNAKLQERYAGAPAITEVTERVLFAPLCGVYLCEGQPSVWLEHLDYQAEFQGGDSDWRDCDAVREYADTLLLDEPNAEGGRYVHTRSVWNSAVNAPLEGKWRAVRSIGVFYGEDNEDIHGQGFYWAREEAQGNHLV